VALLESAVARRLDAERSHSDLETELEIMRDDRPSTPSTVPMARPRRWSTSSVTDCTSARRAVAPSSSIGTVEGVLGRAGERGEA
jgi:hypothetical protein